MSRARFTVPGSGKIIDMTGGAGLSGIEDRMTAVQTENSLQDRNLQNILHSYPR
ncbi:hypothetical protein N9T38_00735 [SAR116 cluster bacterium]|nr:hypothetical protein [SAR116 cluster bacterium]